MNISNFKDMFGQLKGMQEQVSSMQEENKNLRFKAETGGGMVEATVNGEGRLVDLSIDSSLLEKDEMHILPDLVKKAVQEAQNESQKASKEKMADKLKGFSGDLNIPGLDKLIR